MILYIYEGKEHRGKYGEALIRRALLMYAKEKGAGEEALSRIEDAQIHRTDKGKPYCNDVGLVFSVSHTGSLWVCLVGESPLGVDVQEERPVDGEKLAARFFTSEEALYVRGRGSGGFYDIWLRKEAYAKYLGTGLSGEGWLNRMSMVSEGDAADRAGSVIFKEIELGGKDIWAGRNKIRCIACTETEEEIWTRVIR